MEDADYPSVQNPDGSESEHMGASTSVAAAGYASARENKKMSNTSPGNISIRMRGEEQMISNAMKNK